MNKDWQYRLGMGAEQYKNKSGETECFIAHVFSRIVLLYHRPILQNHYFKPRISIQPLYAVCFLLHSILCYVHIVTYLLFPFCFFIYTHCYLTPHCENPSALKQIYVIEIAAHCPELTKIHPFFASVGLSPAIKQSLYALLHLN